MRTLHDLGPEIRRAISGSLDDEEAFKGMFDEEEPQHRVFIQLIFVYHDDYNIKLYKNQINTILTIYIYEI